MKMEQSVPKRRHIKFRRRGITSATLCAHLVFFKFYQPSDTVRVQIMKLLFYVLSFSVLLLIASLVQIFRSLIRCNADLIGDVHCVT
jgi:hypothetical protein